MKIIIAYLVGLIVAHIVIIKETIFSVIILLFMSFIGRKGENIGANFNPYFFGSIATYLCYYLLTRKKITKLFLYCWIIIPIIATIFTINIPIFDYIENRLNKNFLSKIYNSYYLYYGYSTAFIIIRYYIFLQITVLTVYLIAKRYTPSKYMKEISTPEGIKTIKFERKKMIIAGIIILGYLLLFLFLEMR